MSLKLSPRFTDALALAAKLHAGQMRKTDDIPYLAHLLSVAALVLEDGGSEDEAIAALLHDAPEDQGGKETLAMIEVKFGPKVAEIVEVCSDTFENPKPPWRERKEAHLAHLQNASSSIYRVVLADKLHNARSLLQDLRQQGEAIWEYFNGGKAGTLWYYKAMHTLLAEKKPGCLADEFGRVIAEIEELAGS